MAHTRTYYSSSYEKATESPKLRCSRKSKKILWSIYRRKESRKKTFLGDVVDRNLARECNQGGRYTTPVDLSSALSRSWKKSKKGRGGKDREDAGEQKTILAPKKSVTKPLRGKKISRWKSRTCSAAEHRKKKI